MMILRTFYECYSYLKMRMEKCGYEVDFIQNPVTRQMFVTVNGYRGKVEGCGAATPIPEVYKHLQDAFKLAWQKHELAKAEAEQAAYVKSHEVTKKDFAELLSLSKSYDSYTVYIDSYEQQKEAEARNDSLNEKFNAIMQKYFPKYNKGIPMACMFPMSGEAVEDGLKKFIWDIECWIEGDSY